MNWLRYDTAWIWLKTKHPRWHIEGERLGDEGRTLFTASRSFLLFQASAATPGLAARRLDALLSVTAQLPRGTAWNDRGLRLGDKVVPARSLAAGKLELAAFVLAGGDGGA